MMVFSNSLSPVTRASRSITLRLERHPAAARLAYVAAIAITLSLTPLSTVRGQTGTADSLAHFLSTPDVHVRAEAVARLTALPLHALSGSTRRALIVLLEQEATSTAPTTGETPAEEDETYGEYIIDLTSGVLRLRDPAALRGLARLGIETSDDAQRFVASYGAQSLPFLDEAWASEEGNRAPVITTWALMLGTTGPGTLRLQDRNRILARLLAATDEQSIAVAHAASLASLTALIPALEDVARRAIDNDIVRARAQQEAAGLAALRATKSPTTVLAETSDWVTAFCESGGATGARHGTCTSLINQLQTVRKHLVAGRVGPATNVLQAIVRKAEAARVAGIFSAPEAALVTGGARYIIGRL